MSRLMSEAKKLFYDKKWLSSGFFPLFSRWPQHIRPLSEPRKLLNSCSFFIKSFKAPDLIIREKRPLLECENLPHFLWTSFWGRLNFFIWFSVWIIILFLSPCPRMNWNSETEWNHFSLNLAFMISHSACSASKYVPIWKRIEKRKLIKFIHECFHYDMKQTLFLHCQLSRTTPG